MTIAKFINTLLLCLTLLAFSAQFFIDFSTDNIAVSCIILTSVFATLLYLRWSKALDTYPLSSFSIFGFCVTSQLGALLAQSFSWVAVSANLHQPLVTFSMLAVYQFIALVAHIFYRIMFEASSPKPGLMRYAFLKFGVYATPSAQNLWIMGGIGLLSLLISNASAVAHAMGFLAWTPFLIPIYVQQVGKEYCNVKRNYMALFVFAMLIALMAMAVNARGMMFTGAVTVGLLFLLIGMRSAKPVTSHMLLKLGLFGLLGLALSWPASNLVTAMVVARGDRGKVSGTEMVKKTLENFQNPEKIEKYNKLQASIELHSSYDEKYIENPVAARFVITKFHDNAIYFGDKINDKGIDELMKVSGDFLWATLPQPWLDILKVDVNKENLQFSMGDMLVNLAVGASLGGYRTGSIFGQGLALFGYFFPVIYFAMCFILFAAIDIFSVRTASGLTALSVIGMLNVWPNFLYGITAESLHFLFMSVVRGIFQSVLLYVIAFYIAKILSNLLSDSKAYKTSSLLIK